MLRGSPDGVCAGLAEKGPKSVLVFGADLRRGAAVVFEAVRTECCRVLDCIAVFERQGEQLLSEFHALDCIQAQASSADMTRSRATSPGGSFHWRHVVP